MLVLWGIKTSMLFLSSKHQRYVRVVVMVVVVVVRVHGCVYMHVVLFHVVLGLNCQWSPASHTPHNTLCAHIHHCDIHQATPATTTTTAITIPCTHTPPPPKTRFQPTNPPTPPNTGSHRRHEDA